MLHGSEDALSNDFHIAIFIHTSAQLLSNIKHFKYQATCCSQADTGLSSTSLWNAKDRFSRRKNKSFKPRHEITCFLQSADLMRSNLAADQSSCF